MTSRWPAVTGSYDPGKLQSLITLSVPRLVENVRNIGVCVGAVRAHTGGGAMRLGYDGRQRGRDRGLCEES